MNYYSPLPTGAKQYIVGNDVSQTILRRIIDSGEPQSKHDIAVTMDSADDGALYSALVRLKGYGILKKAGKGSFWQIPSEYERTIKLILYGDDS